MAFQEFTTTEIIAFGPQRISRAMTFKIAAGGNVQIQTFIDGDWQTSNTITEDSTEEVFTQNLRLRFLPSGSGTVYSIDMAERLN